jgi:threonine aldolase
VDGALWVDDAGAERSLSLHSGLRRSPERLLGLMRERLAGMPAGGPDGAVAVLERRVAELLGKPAALFFPTGTMAQQVTLRVHADRLGRQVVAFHPQAHPEAHELHGYQVVHGLRAHLLGDRYGPITAADLAAVAEPLAAVLVELPQRDLGGQLPEWDDLVALVGAARAAGAAVHLDGARLWEAQPYYDRPHATIAALFDTCYVSLYKGLEGVRGAVLAGAAEHIDAAAAWRSRLGGSIPDAWPLAAAGLIGLDDLLPRMPAFLAHARGIAAALGAVPGVRVVVDPPQTPLFHIHLPVGPAALAAAARAMVAERKVHLLLYARSAPDPRASSFEVCVGENSIQFTPAEVAALVGELQDRAAGG